MLSVFVGSVDLSDGLCRRCAIWDRRNDDVEGEILVQLRIGKCLVEMSQTAGNLSVSHEMPGQLAEYRLVFEGLLIQLLEGEVVRAAYQQAVRERRPGNEISSASLRHGSLRGAGIRDVPVAETRLVLIEPTHDIVEDVRRVGFGHEPHFLAEGMRRVSKEKRVDESRVGRNPGVVRQEITAIKTGVVESGILDQRTLRGVIRARGGDRGKPRVVAQI